jgi:hypothetical protein
MPDNQRPIQGIPPPWIVLIAFAVGFSVGYFVRPEQQRWHFDHVAMGNGISFPIRVNLTNGDTELFNTNYGWRRVP